MPASKQGLLRRPSWQCCKCRVLFKTRVCAWCYEKAFLVHYHKSIHIWTTVQPAVCTVFASACQHGKVSTAMVTCRYVVSIVVLAMPNLALMLAQMSSDIFVAL